MELLTTVGANPAEKWKVQQVQKAFDKSLKGYAYELGTSSSLSLPKDERRTLALVQPYLVLQVIVPEGRLSRRAAAGRAQLLANFFGGAVWGVFRENANCGDPPG